MGNATAKTEIHQGPIECGNREIPTAYFAEYLSCFLFQLPYKLDDYKFEYLAISLVLTTILISIFGSIKQNYRWFILNQSIFDLVYCYEFVCIPTEYNKITNQCYFPIIDKFLFSTNIIQRLPSVGLFLITGFRFASIYYPSAFKKWNKTWKSFLIIICYDVIYVILIWLNHYLGKNIELLNECIITENFEEYSKNPRVFVFEDLKCGNNNTSVVDPLLCYYMAHIKEKPCLMRFYYGLVFRNILNGFEEKISTFLLLSSSIFVVCLIAKLIRQMKFQASSNIEMLKINIRLVIIFCIQTAFLTFLWLTNSIPLEGGIIYWLDWLRNRNTHRAIQEIRVVVDSIVILIVMSGYRENLVNFVLYIFGAFKNPRAAVRNAFLKARKIFRKLIGWDDEHELVKKYMVAKEKWLPFKKCSINWFFASDGNQNYNIDFVIAMAYYQFYFDYDTIQQEERQYKFIAQHSTPDFIPDGYINDESGIFHYTKEQMFYLTFPNPRLKALFKSYKEKPYLQFPKITHEKFVNMADLYDEIKSFEGKDEEKWFEALTKAEDIDFVSQNVELRLGRNLTNKTLWKAYINYLKMHDPLKLLHTYSKYCHFWLDDLEMKEEYRKAVEKYGPIEVSWINPFDFEIYTENAIEEYCAIQDKNYELNTGKYMNDLFPRIIVPLKYHFSSKNALHQKLSFKNSFIHYILQNSNGFLRQKLFMSCRYFYTICPTPVCSNLSIYDIVICIPEYGEIVNESCIQIPGYGEIFYKSCADLSKIPVNNLVLINKFQMIADSDSNTLSSFMPKVYRCDAEYVEIRGQKLKFEDLKLLIKNATRLRLSSSVVFKKNADIVYLEEILENVLKIQDIGIYPANCRTETSEIISYLTFQNKFDRFSFTIETGELELHGFIEFIKKNMHSKSFISLRFDERDIIWKTAYKEAIDNAINEKWTDQEKPTLRLY